MLPEHLMQDQEQALELEARRLSQLQLAGKHLSNQSCFGYSMDELKLSEEGLNPALDIYSSCVILLYLSSLHCRWFKVIPTTRTVEEV